MVTIKDISQKAGLSEATVSRVINKSPLVKPETKEKVEKIIDELNYFPDMIARGMRSKRTNSIGLILADITNPFYAETAKKIIEIANRKDYSIILCNTNNDLHEQQKYVDILMQRKVDGIIFASVQWKDQTLQKVIAHSIPHMLYNRITSNYRMLNYVTLDNEMGAFLAIQHLYKLGHRKIALISGPQLFSTARERAIGYIKALDHFDMNYDSKYVVQGKYRSKQSYDAAKRLFSMKDSPTAIFASNDLMALSTIDAIFSLGLKIPEDVSIVGFDDIEMSGHSAIQLTTISQNRNMMAEIAIETICKLILKDNIQEPTQIILKPILSVRKTTGEPRKV